MAILTVGAGKQFSTLAAAIGASHNGDVIRVQAGTYTNDFATIDTVGIGGMVNLVATQPPPNGKGILVTNTDVTVTNIAFSGAKVADGNGAGIRYQGGNLTINNCYFHDNQDGLLANAVPTGNITINHSEFAHNGTGDGRTHNIYVNQIAKLTISASYFHDAVVGHEIKSRASTTIIQNSRIIDGPSGSASYSIDLPNGGNAIINNNIIEQGPNSQNPAIIHVGGKSPIYAGTNVLVANNMILNDMSNASARAVLNQTTTAVTLRNNEVFGLSASQIANGPATIGGTKFLTSEPPAYGTHPWQTGIVPPDQLVLYLAQDAGQGNAQFIASVDGKQVGPAQSVTASFQAAQANAFSFGGTFGPDTHSLSIQFVSDTSTGPNAATRHLHVDAVDFDGRHYAAATASLLKDGVATFTIGEVHT